MLSCLCRVYVGPDQLRNMVKQSHLAHPAASELRQTEEEQIVIVGGILEAYAEVVEKAAAVVGE